VLYGMMRVKNEERWIGLALKSLLKVCEFVFVMDDHSKDNTASIVQDTKGCLCIPSPFCGLNESRDKTFLLSYIVNKLPIRETGVENSPHWVICLDGDEELCAEDIWKLNLNLRGVSYSFQILTLYNSPNQIRVDGPYTKLLRPSMFRLIKPGMVFKSNAQHGGGLHCSNVPADIGFGVRVHEPEPVRVKHYGYMLEEDRKRKYGFYVEHDPGHENWYQGECFGVPELVALPEGL
jgi:glycosyltransferase involved in cell wall biosynthesis